MNQEQLREYLKQLADTLEQQDQAFLDARLESLVSVFPFNEYEYILMFLRDHSIITFAEYEQLRNGYVSSNKYLSLYGLAPRIFGQIWGEQHLRDLDTRFKKANTTIDPSFQGEYDLWINGIKVEVKAARAIDTKQRGNIVSKALRTDSDRPFWMNYQQLKLDTCDVFVFIGVWVDAIKYWVLSNNEVKTNQFLSHQHRGGIEYQIGITNKNMREFLPFLVAVGKVADRVLQKAKT